MKMSKIVLRRLASLYEIMVSEDGADWELKGSFAAYDRQGNEIGESCPGFSPLVNADILHSLGTLANQGYMFMGYEVNYR